MMAAASDPLVLIVEDEPAQAEVLGYSLGAEGYRVAYARDGEDALLIAEETQPDLVVLDWMLPKLSGLEVCRRLKGRPATERIPVIMLTARGEEADRVRGLNTGADDYVVKPFSMEELAARVRALLRRTRPAGVGVTLEFAGISLDPEQHKVSRDGKRVKLGPTEFRLLMTLMEKPGRVWSRDQLLDRVWGRDNYIDLRTVDVHVGRLRNALNKGGAPDPIRTVRGSGYSLDTEQ